MGSKFSRRPEATAPTTVAASALRRDQAPEDEEARQAPLPATATTQGVGGRPDPVAQAAALVRASGGRLARAGGLLLRWQQEFGNRHVQQVVQHALRAVGPAPATGSSLTLGPAEDRYEQQADQVARRLAGGAPSRQATGDATASRGLPAPAMQDEHGGLDGRVRQAIQGARGGGQPLPQQVRDRVEPVVGADLGRVRLHTDARADQLARALGARAFTTGGEVFLRRGAYRPDSPAGQRLLAHELTHVAQQAGGTVDADGVSGVSPGVAGAGVIQRIRIDGKETENKEEKTELLDQIGSMTVSQLHAMREEINQAVSASNAPATRNVRSLLHEIDFREPLAQAKEQREARAKARHQQPPPGEQVKPPVSDRPPPGEQVKPPPVSDLPVPGEQVKPPPVSDRPPPGEQVKPPVKEPISVPRKGRQPQQPQQLREVPPERSVAKPAAEAEGEGAVLDAGTKLKNKGDELTVSAAALAHDPGGEPGAVQSWLVAAEPWLKNVAEFLEQKKGWDDAFKKLSVDTRIGHRKSLAQPIDNLALNLGFSRSEISKRFEKENEKEKKRSELEQEAKRQEQEIADRYGAMLARRQEEVDAGKELVDRYAYRLNIKVDKGPDTWGRYATTVPKLFVEWVFTEAIKQAAKRDDQWVVALLGYLENLRKSKAAAEAVGAYAPGLVVELGGSGAAAGESNLDYIQVGIDPTLTKLNPQGKDRLELLAGEDDAASEARNALVAFAATTFIHEAAHERQYRIYENFSYPWKPDKKFGGPVELGGARPAEWTKDVQLAYDEFEKGGSAGQLQGDPKWQEISSTLGRYSQVGRGLGRDERAKELVSHLMELAYAWRAKPPGEGFRDVFPDGADLLDRVIIKGAAAPGQ